MKGVAKRLVSVAVAGVIAGVAVPTIAFAGEGAGHDGHADANGCKDAHGKDTCKGKDGCKGKGACKAEESADKASCKGKEGCGAKDDHAHD